MFRRFHLRTGLRWRRYAAFVACSFALTASVPQSAAASQSTQPAGSQTPASTPQGTPEPGGIQEPDDTSRPLNSQANKRQVREAEKVYLAGAKKLEHDDLDDAEHAFQQALKLDPDNRNYAIAISVARQHRLIELVQRATKARQSGSEAKAAALLAAAREIDPASPYLLEHSEPMAQTQATLPASPQGQVLPVSTPLTNRSQMRAGTPSQPWHIQAPVLAGPSILVPTNEVKSFTLNGDSGDVLRNVAAAYGIRAIIDDSLEHKTVRFNLENVNYRQAMATVSSMAHGFAVPLDQSSVLIAKDDVEHHQQLEHLLEETIEVPGSTNEQLNEYANVIRTIFDVKQAVVQTGAGTIVVRAPESIMTPLNLTLQGLMESSGEVMIEVKMYEINTTNMTNVGAALPSQFTAFNVEQAATQIVNSNQTLVQQAIAQGYITSSASNLDIALALIGLGLVKSNLATNLIGVFGGGFIRTGISASTNTTFNLGLNSTDTRSLDDVQMRIGNNEEGTIREGTKYPITTSTYTSGISTAASALSNASINGVSVASLLSQYAGGSSATIPQVSYEDLGITLKAKPVIEREGRINLRLDMKIEALSGSTNDGDPVLLSRQFASDLTLKDGESALMVSSVTKTETAAMTGIPGLSELPGFQLPTQQTAEHDSGQLVVIVTPHVVRRRADLRGGPRIVLDVHGTD